MDSDEFSRTAILSQLNAASDLKVEASFVNIDTALSQKDFPAPDMVLINTADAELLENQSIGQAINHLPQSKIALLAANPSMQSLDDAYEMGIAGVISKRVGTAQLAHYVRAMIQGYWVFIRPESGAPKGRCSGLESRYKKYIRALDPLKQQLLRCVALGMTNSQIAEKVFISEGAVKRYLTDMCLDLGISKRVQLTLIASDAGLVTAADLIADSSANRDGVG
ncbi:LuxR C-terminal-related transcriptional regulator [Glutamicibacter sp. JL.03c]|uniref:response regulator transcription factor n=1 Tax=Glutamicibacter sp. JL.03c TaxID=2984842 RepID=UPI0021F7E418|nr:LuxR C-terminal-related transcriptional regulator [Glutamicibacter sp. JL.03c]UYQ77345.1 LuxR C-terminal-related transcriptional regulator [Glutamicibacter sp. JL.03c]